MKKTNRLYEADAAAAEKPAQGAAAPKEGAKPGEAGLVDITAGPEAVLKAIVPDYTPASPKGTTYVVPEDIKKKLLAGKTDKAGPADEVVTLKSGSVKAGELIPTQSNIDIDKSLADQIYNLFDNLKVGLDGGKVNSAGGGYPVLTFGGKYIIDGHHRWSQVCMTNPNAMLETADLSTPAIKGTDDKSILAAQSMTHLILLGVYGKTVVKAVEGNNLLAMTEDAIKQAIMFGKGMKGGGPKKIPVELPICEASIKAIDAKGLLNPYKEEAKKQLTDELKKQIEEKYAKGGKWDGGELGKPDPALVVAAALMYEKNLGVLKGLAAKSPVKTARAFMPQPADSGDANQMTSSNSDAIKKAASGEINFLNPLGEGRVIKTFEKFMQKWKKGDL